ncbi:hypothetical protein Tco_1018373 [Tanacetum coccineum]|uniref:Uncharacterized protein n=1 Tax=Tanacetum coccineum TaxID=301880 RepID=A0ABQ5FVL9_9ASTR
MDSSTLKRKQGLPPEKRLIFLRESLARLVFWEFILWERREPIRHIHQGRYGVSMPALTKDHKRNEDQYAISRGLNTPYSRYGINIIFWKISNVLNTAYPLPLDTAYPVLCPIQRIHPNILIRLRMTKVIKGEFEKIKDIKVEDDSLTCDSPLEVFNCEVSRLNKMDDDLFTYEVEIANIPCDLRVENDSEHEADDMGFYPSDIAFTECRGDDEVELTDEEFFDNEAEIAEVFRIDTNIFDYETPICLAFNELNYLLKVEPDLLTKDIMGFKTYDDYKDDWIYEWNKDVPWVDEKPWTDIGMIKYSFGQGKEYVAIKEDEYDKVARPSNNACRTYQEIFRMMDEGWMVTRAE